MRVAIDTDVLVSAVATRGLCADLVNLLLAEHELVVGETVLTELKRVLREKIRLPRKMVDEYDTLLRQECVVVNGAALVSVKIRDKTDVPVLSEAIAGHAEVLMTGDVDLLAVTDELPLQVLTPRGLWDRLRQDRPPDQ